MMKFGRREIQRGFGADDRPLTKTLWERDSRPKIEAMTVIGNHDPARANVDFRRYYDPAYAAQEVDKLWLKVWMYACREEDIPAIGDRVPYQVGPLDFLIIRSGKDEFKAFFNSCIHRGTQLCSKKESGAVIRCPFHGWEWNVDGSLKLIPSHWDFKSVRSNNGALREVKVGRWGGFIYINADPNSAPFEEAIGPVSSHFANFDMGNRYTAARFRKVVKANWKVVQEAFMESYHVYATHPEAVPYNGDSQTQYDIWASPHGHVGRQVTPSSIPSMHATAEASPIAAAMVYAQIMKMWHYPDAELPVLDPLLDPRAQIGQWHRDVQEKFYGKKNDDTPDAVMIDSTLYFIFPHSTLWLSESLPFAYKFTPHQTDTDKSYFEVRMLLPCPSGKPRPPSSETIEINEVDTVTEKAPAFSFLSSVFDQDMANMPLIQTGMKAADPTRRHSVLGTYQEMIIQHWNDVLDELMSVQPR